MLEHEQTVFISYAWGGEREEIVNQIDRLCKSAGSRSRAINATWL